MQVLNQHDIKQVSAGNVIPFFTSFMLTKADYPFYTALIAGTMLAAVHSAPLMGFAATLAPIPYVHLIYTTMLDGFLSSVMGIVLGNYLPEVNKSF